MLIKKLLGEPLFMIGFIAILLLLIGSFVFSIYYQSDYEPATVLYDENKLPIENAPFSPSFRYPLGSDKLGYNMVLMLLEGAKYTIGLAAFIAVCRLVLSFFVGFILYLLPKKIKSLLHGLTDVFYYAPLTIFAYFLIAPVLVTFSWSYEESTRLIYSITVIILMAVPILSLFIAIEIEDTFREEFVRNAKILGGGRIHVFRKHVAPFLTPKILVVFVQQIGQVLMIFAHLGLLEIFIGGTERKVMGVTYKGEAIVEAFSMSHEWGGLIAKNFAYLSAFPWLVIGPVVAFAFTILAINFIVEGLKRAMKNDGPSKKLLKKKSSHRSIEIKLEHFKQIGLGNRG